MALTYSHNLGGLCLLPCGGPGDGWEEAVNNGNFTSAAEGRKETRLHPSGCVLGNCFPSSTGRPFIQHIFCMHQAKGTNGTLDWCVVGKVVFCS